MRVIEQPTRIAPFGDLAGALPLCGAPLAAHREAEVRASGVDPARLTFSDAAFATAPVLARFARAAPKGLARLVLPAHPALALLAELSSVERTGDGLAYDVFLDAPPDAPIEALRAEASPVLVAVEPAVHPRALPRFGPPPHTLPIVVDGAFAMHFEAWPHFLWGAPAFVARARATGEGKRRRGRRGLEGSLVGEGADVHPSAELEGAVIGPGAEIGAKCVIRHSYVGAESRLSDFTKVAYSVLGPETHTLADATFEHMVAMGGGTLTNLLLQDSLLGRQVFLTTGVIFWRDALGETITVRIDGEERSSGRKILGGCAGHGSVLGARTIVAPGRALPNRTTVVMRKEEGVHRIDPRVAEGAPGCWYDGALVPTAEVDPGYHPEELE